MSTCRPTPPRPTSTAAHRPGDNLFAESLVCLDVTTGQRVWHFQTVHHGLWDYDNPAAPNLLDITVNGRRIKAVAQITKQGFVYTFDRVTGKPVWPIDEKPVPPSDVPGEQASPTQPFPTQAGAVRISGRHADDLADFTPELRAMAAEGGEGLPDRDRSSRRRRSRARSRGPGRRAEPTGPAPRSIPSTGMLYVPIAQRLRGVHAGDARPALDSNLLYMQAAGRSPQMPRGPAAAESRRTRASRRST